MTRKFLTGVIIFTALLPFKTSQAADTTLNTAVSATASISNCTALTNNLFFGSRDSRTKEEVTSLQLFLSAQGYFNLSPTGYFGTITNNSVKKFQGDRNILASGFVGPLTRAEIKRSSCGGGGQTQPHITSILPTSGTVATYVTISGSGFTSDNTIAFGGGVLLHMPGSKRGTVITFIVPDSLNPACYYSEPMCLIAIRQTTPGNYDVYVTNANGTSNSMSFTVTSGSANSVSISGIDAPSQLKVGQTSTWTVRASDSSGGGSLSYSVVWGDEMYMYGYIANTSVPQSVQQSATFAHTYNNSGSYAPVFTVTNGSGAKAIVSASVVVSSY